MTKHPAKYNDSIMDELSWWLADSNRILDPFGGTGKLKQVRPDAICMDIEPEWGKMCGLQADILNLPFGSRYFDAVCTSPTYGNRMADHHSAKDESRRHTYTHVIGHKLHDNNSGKMQWGGEYRGFHNSAWKECWRVLDNGGMIIVVVKDHIRGGKRMRVSDWHRDALFEIGFNIIEIFSLDVPGNKFGANYTRRVDTEDIIIMRKP